MKGNKLIDDHKQISVNLLKLRSHGRDFEVAVDADKAVAYKQGEAVDIDEIIQADGIFADMKKGLAASEEALKEVFSTTDTAEIVKLMFAKGELQFTQKYRDQLQEQKTKQVLTYIQRHAMNPQTKLPHPLTRIEAAMQEAKVRIDPLGQTETQAKEIVKKLQPILPIAIMQAKLQLHAPAAHAGRVRGIVPNYGTLKQENWLSDGSLQLVLELPAGMQEECMRELNNVTQGSIQIEKQ